MAATQQNGPDEPNSRQSRWTEPDPSEVANRIEALKALSNRQFTMAVRDFISSSDEDRVTAYAVRSAELARKARRAITDLLQDPEKYLESPAEESNNGRRERLRRFRLDAEHEAELLHNVLAGIIARRGFLPPESNPRGRARRRLADEFPERFLELVREEQQNDVDRAAEQKRQRAAARAAGA
ncbi:hypothetical protein OHS33_38625 (plasmid) [Streptomyces sp. NBC_00536]|uniref:hypothetical protein n=1 Tax=Streptomyces sp. NBC_00536 TaxID=2975769 RepID=UPI002E8237F3|nr:hypothetical protein [Streptomyces sp. NBC_00536]WUC84418.1 hypothetical protein OHS33_38625 [Streptomyces sp. NBC_00536]